MVKFGLSEMRNTKRKVLIIGGGGFIGSWLAKELANKEYDVSIIDPFVCHSKLDGKIKKSAFKFRREELLKNVSVIEDRYEDIGKKILDEFQPEIVVHLAATAFEEKKDIYISKKQILYDIPLTFQIALDVAQNKKVKKFIYMSSIFAYGNITKKSISEDTPLNPITPYGISKATGEFIVKSLLDEKDWTIIRTTSVYGFGDANLRATQIFVNEAVKGEPLWVNKDSWLDFIYIKDLVGGIVKVIGANTRHEVFHLSGGHAAPLARFVEKLKKHFPDLNYEVREGVNDRPRRGTMENTKARILLGWEPQFSLEEGIIDYLKYAKKANHG